MNWERRLPPVAEEALDVLDEAVGDTDDGLPKDEAKALLADDDRFTDGDDLRGTLLEERSDGWLLDEESGRLIHVYPQDVEQIVPRDESG